MGKKNRLTRWKKEEKFPILFNHPVDPEFQKLLDKLEDKEDKFSNVDVIKLARELIFAMKDGIPIIHMISPVLDTQKLDIKYDHFLDIVFDGEPNRGVVKGEPGLVGKSSVDAIVDFDE